MNIVDWLHQRLCERYPLINVPELPEKQVTGRYEDDFVEKRKCALEQWLRRVGRHPVLSKSLILYHFLSAQDEVDWKRGKRAAEKDPLSNEAFFKSVSHPESELPELGEPRSVYIDAFKQYLKDTDTAFPQAINAMNDLKASNEAYKSKVTKLGEALLSISESEFKKRPSECTDLVSCLVSAASALKYVGVTHVDAAKNIVGKMSPIIFEQQRLAKSAARFLDHNGDLRAAITKARRLREKNELSASDQVTLMGRANTQMHVIHAEVNEFDDARTEDFLLMLRDLLTEYVHSYQASLKKLQDALAKVNEHVPADTRSISMVGGNFSGDGEIAPAVGEPINYDGEYDDGNDDEW